MIFAFLGFNDLVKVESPHILQLSCYDMYKIVFWLDDNFSIMYDMYFYKIWSMRW